MVSSHPGQFRQAKLREACFFALPSIRCSDERKDKPKLALRAWKADEGFKQFIGDSSKPIFKLG